MKIHIIGGSGSGKSFIARKLGEGFSIPVLDLDDIFWDRGADAFNTRANPEQRDWALEGFLQKPNWIVEGVYHRWLEPSFAAADTIIALTPPLWLRQLRIVRRFLLRKCGVERGKKESLRDIWQLLSWNRHYDADNLARADEMLLSQARSFTRCSNLAEVLVHLRKMGFQLELNAANTNPRMIKECGEAAYRPASTSRS